MFQEGPIEQDSQVLSKRSSSFPSLKFFSSKASSKKDTTRIGNLIVPSIGVGTISWSSDSLTTLENLELQALVNKSYFKNAALFDTAERYGSHIKTALGLGWGETETLLNKFLDRVPRNGDMKTLNDPLTPIVATKFTPSPWRTTVESVVEACEQSRKRLGVEQIDLYQLHMPGESVSQTFHYLECSQISDILLCYGKTLSNPFASLGLDVPSMKSIGKALLNATNVVL